MDNNIWSYEKSCMKDYDDALEWMAYKLKNMANEELSYDILVLMNSLKGTGEDSIISELRYIKEEINELTDDIRNRTYFRKNS